MSSQVRSLTRSALSAAAGVTTLYIGSVLPGAKLSFLWIATLGVVFRKMSCSGWWPLGCYAVTALLSLLLLPDKTLALLYSLFMGFYPLLKLRAERLRRIWSRWAVKLGCFHVSALLLWAISRVSTSLRAAMGANALWFLWAAGLAFFLLYDYVLGQLILYYIRRFSGRVN